MEREGVGGLRPRARRDAGEDDRGNGRILRELGEGFRVRAIRLEGLRGTLEHPTQPDLTFAHEVQGRVRVVAGLDHPPILVHDGSWPGTAAELKSLRAELRCTGVDALVVVWGAEEDTVTAADEIRIRYAEAFKLADMGMEIECARLLLYKACWLRDNDMAFSKEAAMAKLYCSEVMYRCANHAVQLHGGYGLMQEYDVERFYRDQKLLEIGEGTSEVQRLVIARHIGAL